MAKVIEIEASTVEEATNQGLQKLDLTIERVKVEVLGEQNNSVRVRMIALDLANDVKEFIDTLLSKMGMECDSSADIESEKIKVNIKGKDSSRVIGYRGETLDAIQYLAVISANKGNDREYIKVIVDSENYREKRNMILVGVAKKLAYKASKSNKKVELEPMNPFERRIIHTALQNNQYVETISEGEGQERHVCILPKKKKEDNVSLDILGASNSNFKKNGPKKMRSFGYSRNKF